MLVYSEGQIPVQNIQTCSIGTVRWRTQFPLSTCFYKTSTMESMLVQWAWLVKSHLQAECTQQAAYTTLIMQIYASSTNLLPSGDKSFMLMSPSSFSL